MPARCWMRRPARRIAHESPSCAPSVTRASHGTTREGSARRTQELARAVGLGGRARRAGAAAERARLNVSRAIAAVLRKLSAEHRGLGEHLAATIRTGAFCSYAVDAGAPVRWEF